MIIQNAGEKTSTNIVGPNEYAEKISNEKAVQLQEKLAAHQAKKKSAWSKFKSLFSK